MLTDREQCPPPQRKAGSRPMGTDQEAAETAGEHSPPCVTWEAGLEVGSPTRRVSMDAQPSSSWLSRNGHRRRGIPTPMPPASCPRSPPREPLPGSLPPRERTLGSILPHSERTWMARTLNDTGPCWEQKGWHPWPLPRGVQPQDHKPLSPLSPGQQVPWSPEALL